MMTTETPRPAKPVPQPANPTLTKPFWDAAKRHELVLPRCLKCSRYHFYPREMCPFCLSPKLEWVQASGRAHLYTYAVIYQPAHPAFTPDVPYAFATVQLVEGVMMPSTIVECKVEDLRVDMPLTAVFDDISPEWTLVKFKPA
jgi:uncharacterized OB-fold protein